MVHTLTRQDCKLRSHACVCMPKDPDIHVGIQRIMETKNNQQFSKYVTVFIMLKLDAIQRKKKKAKFKS